MWWDGHDVTEPRRCEIVKPLEAMAPARWPPETKAMIARREYWLVAIEPPYGYAGQAVEELVFYRRDEGKLFPTEEWLSPEIEVVPARGVEGRLGERSTITVSEDTKDIAAFGELYLDEARAWTEAKYMPP